MSTVEHEGETASGAAPAVGAATVADQEADRQRLKLFKGHDAGELFAIGAMSFPEFPEGVTDEIAAAGLDLMPMGIGNKTTVLFQGNGPDGFSLSHAWFAPNYLLPRHSHSADCLYYVLAGQITMGSRQLDAGDGFFINCDGAYAFQAGPDGAEVLEFRQATSFDMKILDDKLDRWKVIAAIGAANAESWTALRAERDA